MTFVNLKQPNLLERSAILALQGLFMNSFFLAYLTNARFCHKFVGYLEEEAVKTYSSMITAIETPGSSIHHWSQRPASKEAIEYYDLK
jgi:ubiquinol oxidase